MGTGVGVRGARVLRVGAEHPSTIERDDPAPSLCRCGAACSGCLRRCEA